MPYSLTRRDLMRHSVAATAVAFASYPLAAFGFAADEEGELVPFLDPQPVRPDRPMLQWDQLRDWITPNEQFFAVSHYGVPAAADPWQLDIGGLVEKPCTLTLDDLKSRPKQEYTATLECSGNGAAPTFMGAVGNARWTGTPLAPILKECGPLSRGIEVVFFSSDQGTEKIREQEFPQSFARSLSLENALRDDVLLAYEMNGEPLSAPHGQPVRLIVPGWYAVAWVKWLSRIEVHDRRFMGRFMGRDYVTIRGEQRGDRTIWRETSVAELNVKSLVARVIKRKDGTLRISGAAWTDGTPLSSVELKIDGGDWLPAQLDREHQAKHSWTFWSYDWKDAAAGEHTLVSRATDEAGRIQPSADDDAIKLKRTYWEANQQYPRKIQL